MPKAQAFTYRGQPTEETLVNIEATHRVRISSLLLSREYVDFGVGLKGGLFMGVACTVDGDLEPGTWKAIAYAR